MIARNHRVRLVKIHISTLILNNYIIAS